MSSSNLEMIWNKIGRKFRAIGGLFFLIIIPYISFAALSIQLILIITVIIDLNDINRELKNPQLNEFRLRYLAGSIVKFIGAIILNVAGAMLAGLLLIGFYGGFIFPGLPFRPIIRFIPIIVLYGVGFVLMIVGSGIDMGAWDNLKSFIVQNRDMFPKNGKDAIEGAEKLKTAATFWVLGFLIIPIIIGWIFHLIGYFTFAKITEGKQVITSEPIKPMEPQVVYVTVPPSKPAPKPTPVIETGDDVNFCPLCGARANKQGLYCGTCGTQLRD